MKKLNKKLTLNKETIASLNNEQMGDVKGGFTYALSMGARCRKSNGFGNGNTCKCPTN